jgi:hypothetical protein
MLSSSHARFHATSIVNVLYNDDATGPSTAPACLPRDSGIGDHVHKQSTQATTFFMPITMRLHMMTTTTSWWMQVDMSDMAHPTYPLRPITSSADDNIIDGRRYNLGQMIISGGRYKSEAELALTTAHGCRRAIRGKGKLGEKALQVSSSLSEVLGAPIFQPFCCSLVVNFDFLPHQYSTSLCYAGARWPGGSFPG